MFARSCHGRRTSPGDVKSDRKFFGRNRARRHAEDPNLQRARTQQWIACGHSLDGCGFRIRDFPRDQEDDLRAVCQHKRRYRNWPRALGKLSDCPKTRRNDSGKKSRSIPIYWNGFFGLSAVAAPLVALRPGTMSLERASLFRPHLAGGPCPPTRRRTSFSRFDQGG